MIKKIGLPESELNKDDTSRYTKVDRETSTEVATLLTEPQVTEESWEPGKWSFPGKNTSIGCPVPNTHTSNIIQSKKVLFRYLYVYVYMHAIAIREKRAHESEGEWGGLYERVEREGGNVKILLNLKNKKRLRKRYVC